MDRLLKFSQTIFNVILVICLILTIDISQPLSLMSTESPSLLFERALQETNDGQYREAVKDWDQLLSVMPDDFTAITNKGNCLLALGDSEGAIDAHSRALEIRPFDLNTHFHRGIAEESLFRWDAAEGDYQWILDNDPNDTSALYNLGNVKIAQGDWILAKELFSKAALLQPEFVMASSSNALVNYQLEEFDEAESKLRILIRQYPMFADPRAALTALLWLKGSTGEAESHWAAVIGLDSRYKDSDWLLKNRRWPPTPVHHLMQFLQLKSL